jgi:hypothetical protein
MNVNLREKFLALTIVFLFACALQALLYGTSTNTTNIKEVDRYIVCPDGQDTCTPYEPHEVKVIYK